MCPRSIGTVGAIDDHPVDDVAIEDGNAEEDGMKGARLSRVAAMVAGATLLLAAAAPATAQDEKPFAGINVNLLTFNGPQVAEPLIRRAPDFEALTGAHINVIAVAFQDIYDKAFLDASLGVNSFDAYVFNPYSLVGDFAGPGYLEDLTDRIAADPSIEWDDIGPFFRDFSATYEGKTYTIPLDGDFHMVYYRSDLIDTPPTTWDEYLAIAEQFNGQDLNEDGEPDYGSCIAKAKGQQSFWPSRSPLACFRTRGPCRARFDTATMDPLLNNEAFALALQTYKKTMDFGPPNEINLGVGDTRGLFTTGRCALSMDWGDIGTLALGTYAQDKTGAVITPGWTQTWNREAGALVPCDETTCPYAVDGVNHAPFASFGGWSGVNAAAPPGEEGCCVRVPGLHELAAHRQRGRHDGQDRLQPISHLTVREHLISGSPPA